MSDLVEALLRAGVDRDEVALVSAMQEYAGASVRMGDLLGNKSVFARARTNLKKGLQGVTNIYAQHKPLLTEIMEQVAKNKLKDNMYPYLVGSMGKDRYVYQLRRIPQPPNSYPSCTIYLSICRIWNNSIGPPNRLRFWSEIRWKGVIPLRTFRMIPLCVHFPKHVRTSIILSFILTTL